VAPGAEAGKATPPTTAPPTTVPPAEKPPPTVPVAAAAPAAEEEKGSGRGLWPRFVAASLVVVISMATATSVSLLVYLTDIAKGLGGLEGLQSQLQSIEGGKPQNFLILGSDERPTDEDQGRSDTTILMRIDPEKDLISLFSLPRDLKVNIPGHGIDRLNAAYTYGGPKLTLETVKQVTGVEVNHVVNVDFLGFADAVNAIDCVYIDVDRHYFNDNTGVAVQDQYAEIDIEAGYQRLCGLKALQYVRYRHEDNDLVRAARQQDFLREARQGVPPGKLLSDRNQLIDIFKKYTTSDINDIGTLVDLFKLLIAARNAPVKEVQFKGDIGGPNASYVTASNEQIRDAVEEFMGEGVEPQDAEGEPPEKPAGEPKKPEKDEPKPDKPEQQDEEPKVDLVDSAGAGQLYAEAVDSKEYDEPIYYPTQLNPGAELTDDSRAIKIDGPGSKEVYYGYKIVAAFQALSYTAYYGISGTDWRDPPILAKPSETREIDGTEYLLFYDGDRLRVVGWKDAKASYWVNNTLGQLLSEDQMLGIATATRKADGR
jgi:LCP family protein required for cell wall assembly